MKGIIEALQLTDTASFDGTPPASGDLAILRIDGTTLRFADGDLLKKSTKRTLNGAIANALACLSWLPFGEANGATATVIEAVGSYYEHISDRLANISLDPELFRRNLARIITVDLAVRAGALDVLDGRNGRGSSREQTPSWADDSIAMKWIRSLVDRCGVSRGNLAGVVGSSGSPVDRILGKKPAIPPAGIIKRMGALLDEKLPALDSTCYVTQLRRHYAALFLRRELQRALSIDHEFLSELLEAFTRTRKVVRSFALSLGIGQPIPRDVFQRLYLTAGQHEADAGLWEFLMLSETPSLWTGVYLAQAKGTFVEWNEQMHAQYAGYRAATVLSQGSATYESLLEKRKAADLLRVAPLIEAAGVLEQGGDLRGALRKLETAAKLAPEAGSLWHSLGKMYAFSNRWSDAETALRQSVELGATTPEAVGDLADLLAHMNRAEEAAALLNQYVLRPETSGMLAWTWALVELRRGHFTEALAHAKAAASAKFKPGHANLIAAEAARGLGKTAEAVEFEKRARELGWTGDKAMVFRV